MWGRDQKAETGEGGFYISGYMGFKGGGGAFGLEKYGGLSERG